MVTASKTQHEDDCVKHGWGSLLCSQHHVKAGRWLALLVMSLGWAPVALSQSSTPTLTLSAAKTEVASGKTTRLSWVGVNVDRCVASGSWSGVYEGRTALKGSFTTPALTSRENGFTLSCTGPGGSTSASVTVLALPKPEITLTATPESLIPGQSVTLNWTSTDAASCKGSGSGFTGDKALSGQEAISDLTKGRKKFSLSCKGAGGTTKVTTEVQVVPVPTLTFSARKAEIAEGQSAQLKWRAKDATQCLASGDWSGEQSLSGSFTSSPLTEDQTYTLSCEGANGRATETVTVRVVAAPEVSLSIDEEVITPGSSATIRWSVTDAQSCKGSGNPFSGDKDPNGGVEVLQNLTKGTKRFKLTCTGGGGKTVAEVSLPVVPAPSLTFSARKSEIAEGQSAQLKWRAKDATRCDASGNWSGEKSLSGSETLGPLTQDQSYTLSCQGANGRTTETVAVRVIPAPVISLTFSAPVIAPGSSVIVRWSSQFATSCRASGGSWSGSKETSGNETFTFDREGQQTFDLECTGLGGKRTTSAVLRVSPLAISGKVIDGYLSGARVFVDMNWSLEYEEGEPIVETDEAGGWAMTPSQLEPFSCYGDANGPRPIIAEVGRGAVDQSRGPVEKPFRLVFLPPAWLGLNLPGSVANLTPFTSLFKTAIANAGGGGGFGNTPIPLAQACDSAANDIADRVRRQMEILGEAIQSAGFSTQKLYEDYIATNDRAAQKKGEVLVDYFSYTFDITKILVDAVKDEVGVTERIFASTGFSSEAITQILGENELSVLPFDFKTSAQGIAVPGGGRGFLYIDVDGIRLRADGRAIGATCVEANPLNCPTVPLTTSDEIYKAARDIYKVVTLGDKLTDGRSLVFAKGLKDGLVDCENRLMFDYEPIRIVTAGQQTLDPSSITELSLAQLEFIYKMPIADGFERFGCQSGDVGLTITKAVVYPPTSNGHYYSLFRFGGQPSEGRIAELLPYWSAYSQGDFIKTPFDRERAIVELAALPSTPNELPQIIEQLGSRGWMFQSGSKSQYSLLMAAGDAHACQKNDAQTNQQVSRTEGAGAIAECYPDLGIFGLPVRLSITKTGDGAGTVTSAPTGITCGDDCNESYPVDTNVTLTATAASDSTFTGWGGACTGAGVCSVKMSEAKNVRATFVLRGYELTVAKSGNGSGLVKSAPASIDCGQSCRANFDAGTTVTLTATAEPGSVFVGWSGDCKGTGDCSLRMSAARSVSAAFVPPSASGSIAGRWTGIDVSRPAFVSVSSAADDSLLKVVRVAADGSFEVTGLDPTKQYIVEPEQVGTRVVDQQRTSTASSVSTKMTAQSASSDQDTSALAVTASPGDYITFTGERIPGLSDGQFVYRWEGNPTVSGAEFASYVPDPVRVELIPESVPLAESQAAVRLAEEYGIILVDPADGASPDQRIWTSEYASRLLELLKVTPIAVSSQGTRAWSSLTYLELVEGEIENDVQRIAGSAYLGGRSRVSTSAFSYASPLLARVEGKRGIFFSNRLFRVVLRIVTENGTRREVIRDLMKSRYGITVATNDWDPLLITPVTCPQFPSDCLDAEWKVFNPDEFFDLLSILEEFPEGLRDFSQPGKPIGLRHLLRRRDGIPHPLYPQAGAVAWPEAGYAEFMESGLRGNRAFRHSLIVHEKAHFVWAGLLSPEQRYDWLKLSGWYRVPRLSPGADVLAEGRCDQWSTNSATWVPPNVTNNDIEFAGAVRHDEQQSDLSGLRGDWASCSTAQFVTPYAASINPNEDFAESMAAYLLNPDLLRSRALPKYEFIRDRLMQGALYLSRIRQDLTFEVFNLYPDYTYPGKIKSLDVKVEGKENEDKKVTVRVELHVAEGCANAASDACFEGASHAWLRIFSRLDPPTIRDISLDPVDATGSVLEGSITISKFSANGWWQAESISMRDKVGNVRINKQSSKDFGWKLYVNNPGEDITKSEYIPNSISLQLVAPGQPLASSAITGDERELVTRFRFRENNAGSCYARTAYADSFNDPPNKIYKGTFDDWGSVEALPGIQPDGATHVCTVRHRVTRFWTSGTYSTVFVFIQDEAGNVRTVNFSQNGDDPTIEAAPTITIQSTNSDGVPPVLDISPCKTSDESERCLRVKATPTNPSSPNGETIVDIFYWAFEDQPLANASGLDGGTLNLRDPLGKTFFFYLNESAGVVNRRPLRRIDGNYYFQCPEVGAPVPCNAVTPVQYQIRIILPAGSAPGIWGIQDMSVYDKVNNSRGYDFTELFRFDPIQSSSAVGKKSALSTKSTGNPFTFEVGVGAKRGKEVSTKPEQPLSRAPTMLSITGRRAAGESAGGERVSTTSGGLTREVKLSSQADDAVSGSRYQLLKEDLTDNPTMQAWRLSYQSADGMVFNEASLPSTARVVWRGEGVTNPLSTSGWVRACSDRVWTVQDGYALQFQVWDKGLLAHQPGALWVDQQSEASVVTDVRCTFGGGVWVEGYVLGVSANEPPLSRSPVPAKRFGFALDRAGALVRRQVGEALFDVKAICAEPAQETALFCREAMSVLAR